MTIRAYINSDFSAILDVYAASELDELRYEEAKFQLLPLDQDTIRLGQLRESRIYLYDEGGVVGYCAHCGPQIRALLVHPESRGKSIGKGLLAFLLAKIPGAASLSVVKSNLPAKNLYSRFGFEVVGEFVTFYDGKPVLAQNMLRITKGVHGQYGTMSGGHGVDI